MFLNISNDVIDLTFATYTVEYYGCLIIVNAGLVANSLNILVSMRKELQKNTMGFYNILMSVFNNLTLIVVAYLNMYPQTIGQEAMLTRSNYSCMLVLYATKIFPHMASWLSVMVTLDRMICVFNTNRFKFINEKRKLFFIALGLFMSICAINVPNLFFSLQTQATYDMGTNQTTLNIECTATYSIRLIRDTLGSITRVLLPTVLSFVINSILICKLLNVRKRSGLARSLSKEHQFAFTIIILNFFYLVLELPILVSVVFVNLYGYTETFISRTSNESAIASFVYVCSYITTSFVYVSLFFVNLLSNRVFRKECADIWLGVCKIKCMHLVAFNSVSS